MWTFEEGKGKVVKDLSGNETDGEFCRRPEMGERQIRRWVGI